MTVTLTCQKQGRKYEVDTITLLSSFNTDSIRHIWIRFRTTWISLNFTLHGSWHDFPLEIRWRFWNIHGVRLGLDVQCITIVRPGTYFYFTRLKWSSKTLVMAIVFANLRLSIMYIVYTFFTARPLICFKNICTMQFSFLSTILRLI